MAEKIIVAGGGIAALEAAVAARSQAPEAVVTMLSAEGDAPYRRPALTKMLSGEAPPAFLLKKPEFYAEQRIGLELNCEVVELNTFNHLLRTADGREFTYDRLCLATGGRARMFNWPGLSLPGVTGCRSIADLREIRAAVDGGRVRNAVVVGGGLLGLEMADSLRQSNLPVTVVEGLPRLLPRQLDEAGSAALEEIVGKCENMALRLGVQVASFRGSDRVAEVELSDGGVLPADLVIVAVGMTPNDQVAAAAGLAVQNGIVTDERCQSSAPDVFAAGDCARVANFNMGLWLPAQEQGKVAGANLAGGSAVFTPEPAAARMIAFGTRLFSLGILDGERYGKDDPAAHVVRSFYLDDDRLQGAMLLGDLSDQAQIQEAVLERAYRRQLIEKGVLAR